MEKIELHKTIFCFTLIIAGERHKRSHQSDTAQAGKPPTRPDMSIESDQPAQVSSRKDAFGPLFLRRASGTRVAPQALLGLDPVTNPGLSYRPDPKDSAALTTQPKKPAKVGSHKRLYPGRWYQGDERGFAIQANRKAGKTQWDFLPLVNIRAREASLTLTVGLAMECGLFLQ